MSWDEVTNQAWDRATCVANSEGVQSGGPTETTRGPSAYDAHEEPDRVVNEGTLKGESDRQEGERTEIRDPRAVQRSDRQAGYCALMNSTTSDEPEETLTPESSRIPAEPENGRLIRQHDTLRPHSTPGKGVE